MCVCLLPSKEEQTVSSKKEEEDWPGGQSVLPPGEKNTISVCSHLYINRINVQTAHEGGTFLAIFFFPPMAN